MRANSWVDANVPDQTGRTVVVTGASAGLGAEAVRLLARRGARVVLAVRTLAKGEAVAATIRAEQPDASIEVRALDLASLASVEAFADALNAELGAIDVLLNNAGVMATPQSQTSDGFELQFGTNHLGHFALTGRLQPALLAAPDQGRVVNVSSMAAASGRMDFEDLMGANGYSPSRAYSQSKLANQLFTYEHQRRAVAAGLATTVVAAHPGLSATDLFDSIRLPGPLASVARVGARCMGQPADMGSLPLLAAATTDVAAGSYWGPNGWRELRGLPTEARVPGRARKGADAARLWDVSQELTGVSWLN